MNYSQTAKIVAPFYQASVHLHTMITQSFETLHAAKGWSDYKSFNDSQLNPSQLTATFKQQAATFMRLTGANLPSTEQIVLFDQVSTSLEEIAPTLDLVAYDWKRLFPSIHEGVEIPFDGLGTQETAQQLQEAFNLLNSALPRISEELVYYIIPNTKFLLDDLKHTPS